MFVRNGWYVGAWADEIQAKPLGRVLLGEPIVFYRAESGAIVALANQCCHRGLPLTHGEVIGECIQCGYHGLVFDPSGACVRVPGQAAIPAGARVKSYPVVEQDALVWIWMGDPAAADPAKITRHPWHGDTRWAWCKDRYLVNAPYQLIHDNLLDLTHVGYVHKSTIGGTPQAHSEAQMKTTRTDSGVKVVRWMLNSIPPPAYTAAVRFNKELVDRWMEIEFFAPSVVRIYTGAVDAGAGAQEGRREGGFGFMGFNAATPETEHRSHYFWSGAHNYKVGEPAVTEQLYRNLSQAFGEDKTVLESQYEMARLHPLVDPIDINADAGGIQARRILGRLIEEARS